MSRLTYFDSHGGRGEVARLAFALGGVAEDDRVSFAAWENRKAETPYGAVPVLEVNGRTVAHSNSINRYVGKLVGLYPDDPWQAALCDWLWHLKSGSLDHIPPDLPDRVAPRLVEHYERIKSHPGIETYYAARVTSA